MTSLIYGHILRSIPISKSPITHNVSQTSYSRKLTLNQPPHQPPNLIPKIHPLVRIPTGQKRQLPRPIIHQCICKLDAAEDLLCGAARGTVTREKLVSVDVAELAVGVAEEVEGEEDGGVWGGGLHFGVGFEGSVFLFNC